MAQLRTEKDNAASGDAKGAASSDAALGKRLHTIKIEDLIVHKYSERDALFTKAAKVAREVIDNELREGEGVRSAKVGVFQLFFPKLTHDAGALRASVIAERVAREIREINPTSMNLARGAEIAPGPAESPASPASSPRRTTFAPPSPKRTAPVYADDQQAAAHREAATRAVAAMAEATSTEELKLTEQDRSILDSLRLMFRPVWHTKNSLITGYHCELTHAGNPVSARVLATILENNSADVAAAKADLAAFKQAAQAINYLLNQHLKALLIVPLHFSTIDRLRYIRPLLEAGGALPEEAKNLLVFELKELPPDLSKFRLRDPVNYLRNRSRALLARVGFEQTDIQIYKELSFHGISADLADYRWDEPTFLKSLERFAEVSEANKLQSFVHGIPSKSLVLGAMGAGIRYMDGRAVAPSVDHPKHIRPYEIDMLYER